MTHSENDPIVIASARDVGRGNKDPYWTNLNLYVWEPLISENDKGEIIPVLAVSWKRSDDAKNGHSSYEKVLNLRMAHFLHLM